MITEYDSYSGVKVQKAQKFDRSAAPKLYYKEEELRDLNLGDNHIIRLMFDNFDLVELSIQDNSIVSQMCVTTIDYKKVHFKNAKVDFVYVQMDQIDLFFRMSLNKELTKEEKKYI